MIRLRPCPKCGNRPDPDLSNETVSRSKHGYECPECGIKGEPANTPNAAARNWNRRAKKGSTT